MPKSNIRNLCSYTGRIFELGLRHFDTRTYFQHSTASCAKNASLLPKNPNPRPSFKKKPGFRMRRSKSKVVFEILEAVGLSLPPCAYINKKLLLGVPPSCSQSPLYVQCAQHSDINLQYAKSSRCWVQNIVERTAHWHSPPTTTTPSHALWI